MKPTPQQQEIITDVALGSGSTTAIARAGSGKTQTFVMSGPEVPEDKEVIACCFNKSIATTMEKKFPQHWICKTVHGLTFGALMQRFDRKLKVEQYKVSDIIKTIPEADKFPDLRKAVGICKAWGIIPRGTVANPRSMFPDEPPTYHDLFDNYGIDVGDHPDPVGTIRQVLMTSASQAWQGIIDFDDMPYLAYCYQANLRKGDLVLIDEAQDISPIMRGNLRQMMRSDSRLIAIGDDRQAIYGFRGADRHSIPKIVEEFDCKTLPLTISFRCAQAVIAEAQEVVPDIEPWHQAPEGKVLHMDKIKIEDFPRGCAILCRNNAPIVEAALKFIKRGIGATVLGREIATGLKVLVDKQKASSLGELSNRMWQDVDNRAQLLIKRNKDNQAALLRDKAECIECLIHFLSKTSTVQDLKDLLNRMFSDKQGVITLSSIHKSKGLEWETVFFLDPGLIPSKYARSADEIEQEHNLRYVAITRAQERLIYIESEGMV
jgi:hypothetical protein